MADDPQFLAETLKDRRALAAMLPGMKHRLSVLGGELSGQARSYHEGAISNVEGAIGQFDALLRAYGRRPHA